MYKLLMRIYIEVIGEDRRSGLERLGWERVVVEKKRGNGNEKEN